MLASIAIIAVLAALSYAGLQNFTASARYTKCISNLKQIGAAMFTYASDNNGQLPPVRQGINAGDVWQQVLVKNGYTSQATMFCPAAAQTGRGWNGTQPDYGASTRTSGNNALVGSRVGLLGDANSPRRLATINNPSKGSDGRGRVRTLDDCLPRHMVTRPQVVSQTDEHHFTIRGRSTAPDQKGRHADRKFRRGIRRRPCGDDEMG